MELELKMMIMINWNNDIKNTNNHNFLFYITEIKNTEDMKLLDTSDSIIAYL